MKILGKINFRQSRYIPPAILRFPLLDTSYFIFDLFQIEMIEIQDKALQTTEFLNPELPEAQIKNDSIGSEYEDVAKSWGKIQDHSAIDNMDWEEPDKNKKEYESKYTQDDIDLPTEEQQEKAAAAEIASAEAREQETLIELEKALAEARPRGRNVTIPPAETDTTNIASPQGAVASGTISEESRAVKTPPVDEPPSGVVRKVRTTSDYFNTLSKSVREPEFIQTIIDEGIRTVGDSHVRLCLFDDVEIGECVIVRGTYLYAMVSGFPSRRMKGNINSILMNDELAKMSLSFYDTDGMEGPYVPNNQFRETSKDVTSGTMLDNMSMDIESTTGNGLIQWGMQVVDNVHQKTSNAISGAIKKNKVKLKYETFVYLVNGQEEKS